VLVVGVRVDTVDAGEESVTLIACGGGRDVVVVVANLIL
jgi:hypothetical protein